jgi:hypothetical protein
MDSTAQTACSDSQNINELVSRVTHGFDSRNAPLRLRNHQQTAIMGEALI